MADDSGHRARIRALIIGFALGIAVIPVLGLLVGSWVYAIIAGLLLGVTLAAIFQDRVTRRRQRRGEEAPPDA